MNKRTAIIVGIHTSNTTEAITALAKAKGVEVQIVDINDLPVDIDGVHLEYNAPDEFYDKIEPDYFFENEAKIDQFQNRNLGEKVGGRKHKKNPFKYNR